ncbi:MAG: TolC family protein [Acidobacteria bacterium]|nr:TolC family protein [Acidobacteriota bacterium]
MKRRGYLTVGIMIAGAIVMCPFGVAAQSSPESKAAADKLRIEELTKYARTTYDQATQQTAPQRPTLEERAQARPVIKLTQDEAVKRALDNNIDLTVARMNPQLQDMSLSSFYAAYLPTVTSLVNSTSSNPLPTSLLNGGTNVTNQSQAFNAGVTKLMPWYGGNLSVGFNNTRTNTNSTFATLNPQYTSQLTATYTQPLWRNFKIDSTRLSILTGKITRELTDVQLKSTIINTQANTRNAYWNLVYSIQALEAAKQSLALAERLVQDNQTRVEVGTLAPMDVISAQAEAATRRQTLTSAEATRRTAEITLKRLIVSGTEDVMWNSTIEPVDRVNVERTPVNLEAAIKVALTQRTDLVQARRTMDSSDITINYLNNQFKPQLDLVATYGTRGLGGNTFIFDSTRTNVIGTVPGNWVDAAKMLSKVQYPNWTVQLNFSYPIGNSTADIAYAKAKVQYKQSQIQLRATELQVATDVTNAALNVESTFRRYEAAIAARQLSEKRLEAEQSKFEVGMSYNYLVVQAQRDLNDARNTELRAALDYRIALTEFDRVQITPSSGGSGGVTAVTGR